LREFISGNLKSHRKSRRKEGNLLVALAVAAAAVVALTTTGNNLFPNRARRKFKIIWHPESYYV